MIVGVTGDPRQRLGCGKSLFAVWLTSTKHEQLKMPIYSNVHLFKTEYNFLEGYNDIIDLTNSIIILDDIYRVFLGKEAKIKKVTQVFSGTSRKDENYIIYTSSRLIDYVQKSLRLHSDLIVKPSFDTRTNILRIRTFDSIEQEIRGAFPAYLPANIVKEVFTRYDTKEKVKIWDIY
jgi:hypothetical protein